MRGVISKEERKALRMQYTEKFPAGYQYAQARIHPIRLLDALEEAEKRAVTLERQCDSCPWRTQGEEIADKARFAPEATGGRE